MAGSAPFYQAFVEIVPEAKGFSKKLGDEFGTAGPEVGKRAGAGISGGILASIGLLAAPIAAAFAGIGIGSLLKDSIGQASDLNEAATAIGEVFGDQAQAIQDFAKAGATAFGETNINVLRAAQNFGIYGKAAGLAGSDLTDFSTNLVGLGTDLASFFNTDTQTAMDAISAGLRGESEPLRQFGVLLDDATLRSRAMTLGIYDGTGALTQQQRVLASQAEILAQTTTAQGDFARTSGGLANQQRILAAGFSNLKTELGQAFLPAATSVVSFMNSSVIPAFEKLLPAVQGVYNILFKGDFSSSFFEGFNIQEDSRLVDVLFTIRESLQSVAGFISDTFGPAFDALKPSLTTLIPELVNLWSALSPLSLAFQALGPVLPQIATELGGSLTSAVQSLAPAVPVLAGAFVQILTALTPLIPKILELLPTIVQLIPPLVDLAVAILPPLVQILGALLPPAVDLLKGAIESLGPIINNFTANLGGLADGLNLTIAFLSGDIGQDEFMTNIQSVSGALGAVITVAYQALAGFISFTSGALAAIRSFATGVYDGVFAALAYISGIPAQASAALGDLGGLFFSSGRALIDGFAAGIRSALGAVGSAMGSVVDFAASFLPHSPAERGQFSGSGWAAVRSAGLAIGAHFGDGLAASTAGLSVSPVSFASTANVPRLRLAGLSEDVAAHAKGSSDGRPQVIQLVVNSKVLAQVLREHDRSLA